MKKLMALLTALLILSSTAAADGTVTRVRYVPAPAGALSDAAECVLAASPDGRYLLAGTGELYIRDTAENRNIPLIFPNPEDAAYITENVMLYMRFTHPALEALYRSSMPEEDREKKLNEILDQLAATVETATGGESCFRNLNQVRLALQLAQIKDPLIEIRGISERYALIAYYNIALMAVELATGECRVYRYDGSWQGVVLANDRVYVRSGISVLYAWDLDRNERMEIALPDKNMPESLHRSFDWYSVAAADAGGNLWILAPDLNLLTSKASEGNEDCHLYLLNTESGNLISIPFPHEYDDSRYLIVSMIDKIYFTGDGQYALIDNSVVHICFAVVNLSDGNAAWNRGTNSGSLDDGTTPMMPVAATENGFICFIPTEQQLVFLDPATMEYTALSFEMRSDDLPGQFREPGMIGIRFGEVWTTITPRMLKEPISNGCGMIFSMLPGYLVIE